jgi:hypothetical protein
MNMNELKVNFWLKKSCKRRLHFVVETPHNNPAAPERIEVIGELQKLSASGELSVMRLQLFG